MLNWRMLLRRRRSPLEMLSWRRGTARNGRRSRRLSVRRGRSLNRSGRLMVIRRRLMLLLLLTRCLRSRSSMWGIAMGWLLLLLTGMVVHVLWRIVVRRRRLNR